MQPVAEAETAVKGPRAAGYVTGAALLLSGLALNPLAFAHFLPVDPLGKQAVLALQVALMVGGGLFAWRRPSLPLGATVLVSAALGALIALGIYGTARSLQEVQERKQRLATLDRSEALQQYLSAKVLLLLAADISQGQLPTALTRNLFADEVAIVDLEPIATTNHIVPMQGIQAQRWEVAPAVQLRRGDIQLWRPLLATIRSCDHAEFHVETGHFLDAQEQTYQARLRFDALAATQDGKRAQIRAGLTIAWRQQPDSTWKIYRWQSEELEILIRSGSLFAEVLDQALPRAEDRARARFSRHAALVRQSFIDSAFIGPHRYFTRQAFDRHPGISVVDIDADGHDDIYVSVRRGRNMLWHNNGEGTFRECAADYGLDIEHHTAAALFADFDNDGDQDVFLGRTLVPSLYLVNEGGRFVARDLGPDTLPALVASISAADYDADGLLDVYFSTYAARMLLEEVNNSLRAEPMGGGEILAGFLPVGLSRKLYRLSRNRIDDLFRDAPGPPNILLRNLGGGRFESASATQSQDAHEAIWRNTLQATWADYDLDGDPDLYLANDFAANNLLRNDGGAFSDITVASGVADPGFGMGASWGDYDADGRQDLYVTNMYSSAGRRVMAAVGRMGAAFAPLARGNSLLRNGSDGFTRVADDLPVEDGGWGWGSQFVDIDNDGDLDIYVPNGYYTAPQEAAIVEDS